MRTGDIDVVTGPAPGDAPEIPKYLCHKEVRALQIDRVEGTRVYFTDTRFGPLPADPSMFARYVPMPGDYWVLYRDGYQSFSPKAEFEDGYARIE